MSDYGVFEASSTDGYEEDQRQRQATRDLGRAIEAAREGFGGFLGAATDKDDYKDRLALVMNDLMQKVADSGVMPVPGVMRKVKAALRPEFKTANRRQELYDALSPAYSYEELVNLTDEELEEKASDTGYIASRKQADVHWYDQNGRQEAHFAGGEHITIFPDGKWEVSTGAFLDSGQAPSVEQAKAESLEALSLLAFGSRKSAGVYEDMLDFTGGHSGHVSFQDYKEFRENFLKDPLSEDEIAELKSKGVETTASRKTADDYVKGDALNFINHLQNGGYRMPKDAGYPGEGGQMDDELYDYTNGDQNRISELVRFLQENWDYYAYGASRTAGAGDWEQVYDGAGEWRCKRNPRLTIMEEDRGYFLFDNISLVGETNTLEQAMELAESHYEGSRKQAYDTSSIPAKHSVWIDEFQGEPGYELTAEGIWEDFKGWAQSRGETPSWDNFDDFLDQYPEADFIDEKIDSELTRKLDGRSEQGAPWRGLGSRKHAESYQLGGGWSARVVYDNDDEGEYAEAIITGPGGVKETIYPGDGRRFEPGEVQEEARWIIEEYGDSAYQDTYQYNSRRKRSGGVRSSRKTASNEALLLDAISDLMLNGSLSAEDQDAIERAYGQGEQGKWEAAYNSVTFVADGPDLGSWEDGLVEVILDGIEDLVGDPSRSAAKKEDLRPGQKVSVGGRNGRIDEIRGDRITVAFPGGGIDFFRADQINTTLASRKGDRKQALEIGEWEEDLPGLGYAKATKTPGGGWEVYIWDEAGQNETLTPVNSSEEARRLFYDTIKRYPGSGYEYIDF